jgi:hypothetical protein
MDFIFIKPVIYAATDVQAHAIIGHSNQLHTAVPQDMEVSVTQAI